MKIIVRSNIIGRKPQALNPIPVMALCVALLTPASLLAFVLAAWRLGADLGFTGEFAIGQGFFSHWIVWTAIGIGIQFCANTLNREVIATER